MCTLILAFQISHQAPVLLGHNRDEQLNRPAAPPALLEDEEPAIVAPLDLRAHGTWLGLNAEGVTAAITNRFASATPPQASSRGALVLEALRASSANEAASRIDTIVAREPFAGFHLAVADRHSAHMLWRDDQGFHRRELEPGVHLLTEQSLGAGPNPREPFLQAKLASFAPEHLTLEDVASLLRHRRPGTVEGSIVALPAFNYGTRSSALVHVGASMSLRFADGPPDQADYRDIALPFSTG